MNHVWTSIALQVSCAAQRHAAPGKAVLRLLTTTSNLTFRGCMQRHRAWTPTPRLRIGETTTNYPSRNIQRTFSASQCVCTRRKASPPRSAPLPPSETTSSNSSDSKLQPAPTKATHREGVESSQDSEVLTWRDYAPDGGMPLGDGELGQSEISAIFPGDEMDVETGNYILNVLHWRRMSGALIDMGLDFPPQRGVARDQALKALEYIRIRFPHVDEQANGQVWASEEAHRLQDQIAERAVRLGIYKANEPEMEEEQEEEQDAKQGTAYGRARHGRSVLQTMRAVNEAKYKQDQVEKQAAEQRSATAALHAARGPLELGAGVQPDARHLEPVFDAEGVLIQRPATKAWLQPVERRSWVKYYEEQATLIKDHAIPRLSVAQRLAPSFAVLLLVLAAAYYLSENYTPPPRSARLWPDTAPAVATLGALTALLAATFLLGRVPPLWRTYSKYMTVVPAYPYALGLVGAGLRHDTVVHLASNLASLWLFGLLLHEEVGRGTFLAVYFGAGALGGFASLTYNVLRRHWMAYIFGSSGAVLGVVAAACALRPHGSLRVAGYDVPIAAWVFLALFAAAETVALARGFRTNIDHAGHIGGLLGGLAMGVYMRGTAPPAESGGEPGEEVASS